MKPGDSTQNPSLGHFERNRDLNEAAGAADAAACSTSNRWGGSNVQINYGSQGGHPCDPSSQNDAGRAPASSLLSSYRKNLHPNRPRFRAAFSLFTQQAWSGTDSAVPGSSVSSKKTHASYRLPVRLGAPFLLCKNTAQEILGRAHSLSQTTSTTTSCPQSGRSGPTH